MSMDVVRLHLRKIELLWSQNRSWSSNSNPANEGLSWDLEVLHSPETNESTGSAKSSLAVNSDGSMVGLGEVVFDYAEEISDDSLWWSRSINKEKIIMSDLFVQKVLSIILFLI